MVPVCHECDGSRGRQENNDAGNGNGGLMVTGFLAAMTIALTLLWIVLTERKKHSSGH